MISIHALRGEGDIVQGYRFPNIIISIHALRGEGDGEGSAKEVKTHEFQSTPSVGRATTELPNIMAAAVISIHALRGEGDVEAD